MGAPIVRNARVMPCPNDDESRVQISSSLKQKLCKVQIRYLTLHISIKHTDHYAIERICSAQNELFKTVLRAVSVAASRSPNRSVKF